ncbi:MAG: hypothetical protein H7287_07340 [Thermoleophilia bacterium]|nr:hypothetical protein [Thermoleophilia bacterium]
MIIAIRDYNLTAARQRVRETIDFERRLGTLFGAGLNRELTSATDAVRVLGVRISLALTRLQVGNGGTLTPTHCDIGQLTPALPLVRAWMILRGHPSWGGGVHQYFHREAVVEPGEWENGPRDGGALLERCYLESPPAWDVERFEATVLEGAAAVFGTEPLDSEWIPGQVYPGSPIGRYFSILSMSMELQAIGALDPAFTRQDALTGEWWLVQPVSPRLQHYRLVRQLGMQMGGYVPSEMLDDPRRVVMAWYAEDSEMSPEDIEARLASSKWVAGWRRVLWRRDETPLDSPTFDFVRRLEGVTEDSYGPYRHSTDLPPWR